VVEAGGVELKMGVENTQVIDAMIPPMPEKPRFPHSLSRFVTVGTGGERWGASSRSLKGVEPNETVEKT
jgi:hypothetical protein